MPVCKGPCGQDLPDESFPEYRPGLRRSACRPCFNAGRDQNGKKRYNPPPLEVVPDGFEVIKTSTPMNADGSVDKQYITAKPERIAERPILDVPEGYGLKRLSTLTNGDGKVTQQWQIFTPEEEAKQKRIDALLDTLGNLAEKWPAREPIKLDDGPPAEERLMCAVPMGDPHFGQYSWAAETGDDYDLQLAEQYHCTAMDELVRSAPPAKKGLLINLGDFVHADNSMNQTLRSHHQLDVDTRWPKVIRSSANAVIWLAKRMLQKFQEVEAWMVPGNHDAHSALMLQLALQLYFKDEPRIHVPEVAGLFYYTRWGNNLVGATHTHSDKMGSLGERVYYCGHGHRDSVVETRSGVLVEMMRTLAGKDKFAAESGYGSGRDMKMDIFDIEDGRVQRNVIGIRQIQRRMKQNPLVVE
jgi:hypothetical protein